MNVHHIIGRVGKDPEIRMTQSGDKVASFSLATSERWKDKTTGEQKEHTDWHRIVVFNQNIVEKMIEPHVKKGYLLTVTGKVQTRDYEDRDGNTRYTTETVVGKFDGSVAILDKPGHRPAPSPDDYGQTRTREPRGEGQEAGMASDHYGGFGSGTPGRMKDQATQRRPIQDDEIPF